MGGTTIVSFFPVIFLPTAAFRLTASSFFLPGFASTLVDSVATEAESASAASGCVVTDGVLSRGRAGVEPDPDRSLLIASCGLVNVFLRMDPGRTNDAGISPSVLFGSSSSTVWRADNLRLSPSTLDDVEKLDDRRGDPPLPDRPSEPRSTTEAADTDRLKGVRRFSFLFPMELRLLLSSLI